MSLFVDSLRPSFESIRETIAKFDDLRSPREVRTRYSDKVSLRLGPELVIRGRIEQRGLNAKVRSDQRFVAPTGRFRPEDVGKELTILKSSVASNLKTIKIASIDDATTVRTDPLLAVDAGPLQWELRGEAPETDGNVRVEVRSGDVGPIRPGWVLFDGSSSARVVARRNFAVPKGAKKRLTEREGRDGTIDSLGRFTAPSGTFSPKDVGKKLALSGSSVDDNNGWTEVVYWKNSTTVATSLLEIQGADSNGHVRYFLRGGKSGVRVWHLKPGPSTAASVSVSGNDIVVTLATNGGSVLQTTAAQVVALIQGSPAASALVTCEVTGTGASLAGETSSYLTIAGYGLTTDAGPIVWAVLPFPILVLAPNSRPNGLLIAEGADLSIISSTSTEAVVRSASARFSSEDVGRILTLTSTTTPKNTGTFRITVFVAPNEVRVATTVALATEANIGWELRTAAFFADDLRRVEVSAPSILDFLAEDFGIEVDSLENESRQRSYVEHANQWMGSKGHSTAYDILAKASGVEITVKQLFRVTKPIYTTIPEGSKYIIPEIASGKSGTSGTLSLVSGRLVFTSATAVFDITDEGKELRLTDTAVSGNNKLYTISDYLTPTSVRLAISESATALPMTFSALPARWEVVRLYTDKAPQRPRYDEINSDLLSTWVTANLPGKVFSVDRFCWEDNFAAYVNVTVGVSTLLPSGRYSVAVTGQADVVVAVGRWVLSYADGTEISLETLPVGTFPNFTFEIASATAAPTGAAKLQYKCPVVLDCSYCPSYRLLCVVEADVSNFETAAEQEKLEERVTKRLQQVVPAHAEAVVWYRTRVTAKLKLGATVET